MVKGLKKLLSCILALSLVMSMVCVTALADEADGEEANTPATALTSEGEGNSSGQEDEDAPTLISEDGESSGNQEDADANDDNENNDDEDENEPENPEPSEPEETNAAKIGETKYETLHAALTAAMASDGPTTIELLKDCGITNGEDGSKGSYTLNNKDVTITGGHTATLDGVYIALQNNAKFTLDGCTVDMIGTPTAEGSYVMAMQRTTEFTLTNGAVLTRSDNRKGLIYTYGGEDSVAAINITEGSKLIVTNAGGTVLMNEGTLAKINITGGSLLDITGASMTMATGTNINGMTTYDMTVDGSTVKITNCAQATVKTSITATNGSVINFDENGTGCNLYSINKLDLGSKSMLTANNCGKSAIFSQGGSVIVRSGASLSAEGCGADWDGLVYGNHPYKEYGKGVITNGVILYVGGDYDGKIGANTLANLTFEDGASVSIKNNLTRGIVNGGTVTLGNGTVITNNNQGEAGAAQYGGGIFNYRGTVTLNGAAVYNNHARGAGDDIYNYANSKGTVVNMSAVGSDWVLDDSNLTISGWFYDGRGDGKLTTRWSTPDYVERYTDETISNAQGNVALKAAHDVYFTVTYTNGVDGTVLKTYTAEKGSATPTPDSNPTRDGYTFTGWSPAVEATVTGDQTYEAQWSQNYIPPVITTTYYTLTINYVDENGDAVAESVTQTLTDGSAYSVTSPVIEGYTADQTVVAGALTANVTVTVVYTADEAEVPEENPPLAEDPEPSEQPDVDISDEEPPLAETPDESDTDIDEPDVPLADVPKTGDQTMIWLALAAASALGLAGLHIIGKRKENEA